MINTPIKTAIANINPKHLNALKELNIYTLKDLLNFFPIKYLDKTKFYNINDLYNSNYFGKYVQIKGKIKSKNIVSSNNKHRLVVTIEDETGYAELIWFHYIQERHKSLIIGNNYCVFGQVNIFNHKINFAHPELELISNNSLKYCLESVYKLSEVSKKFKINNKNISSLQKKTLDIIKGNLYETIPDYIIQENHFLGLQEALNNIHFPKDITLLNESIRRLKFEELFLLQIKLLQTKYFNKLVNISGYSFKNVGKYFNSLYYSIPFKLTEGQRKAIKEIRNDLIKNTQMNRLLQGDVGSGKTIVALFSTMLALDNGYQSCIMSPTEILAQQHYNSVRTLLKHTDVKIALLIGSTPKKERAEILENLKENKIHILIGTHTIIQPNVKFCNLGLAVIDEQHKFGVKQRAELWKKNLYPPHLLIMSATPIPRTLAMTAYGNLDISVIDTLPKGRIPIITTHRYEINRAKVYDFIKMQIHEGRQAYIVYPLIEESESLDYLNLIDGYKYISKVFNSSKYTIGLVHGKMSTEEKQNEMHKFKEGLTNILVATPVIEVGVDIPNATVMLIESANRFGLSQLHQLRGRIGRSNQQSYCILMTSYQISQEVKYKLETMVKTNDGFLIADADLKLRGPGDAEGVRQSGVLELKIANLIKDSALVKLSQQYAQNIFNTDPELKEDKHKNLFEYISNIKNNTMANIS